MTVAILLVALAIILPFFSMGSAAGHDFQFHVASWLDVAYQWQAGVAYPHWTVWTNFGFGEPRYIFYPPLSWMLGAALTLVAPVVWVPPLFVAITQALAGFCCYRLLRRLTGARGALLGALCYEANPNALLMVYIRSDFAEQLACAIFPLLLLEALELCGLLEDVSDGRRRWRHLASFALLFAAVWLCNAPAGVIASYSMAAVFATAAVLQRSWRSSWRGMCGLALGFGLAAFYLVPAAYEQRWVNIAQALASGLLPAQNFLFTNIDDVEHTWFNWIASTCAIALIVGFLLAAWRSREFARGAPDRENPQSKLWIVLLALGSGATVLMLPFSNLLWTYLPKLRYVQFTWRWMSIVALVYACFLGSWTQRRRGWLAALAILMLTLPLANFLIDNGWWDPDEMPTEQAAITDGTGYDGTDEYDPVGDDHSDLAKGIPLARVAADPGEPQSSSDTQIKVVQWAPESKRVDVQTKNPAVVALRLLNYPAWQVTVNGSVIQPDHANGMQQMLVPVSGGASEIDIRWVRTPDRLIGILISVCALLVWLALLVLQRQK